MYEEAKCFVQSSQTRALPGSDLSNSFLIWRMIRAFAEHKLSSVFKQCVMLFWSQATYEYVVSLLNTPEL